MEGLGLAEDHVQERIDENECSLILHKSPPRVLGEGLAISPANELVINEVRVSAMGIIIVHTINMVSRQSLEEQSLLQPV